MITGPLTSVGNVPKMSTTTLELKKNFYVVHDGTHFHYFPVKIQESGDAPILRFEKSPPILMEGVVIVGQPKSTKCRVYRVPVNDLIRGVIRKSREIKPTNRVSANDGSEGSNTNDNSVVTQEADKSSRGLGESVVHAANKSGALEAAEMEISKAADIAWEDQIGTLLHHISSQEGAEWEIAGDSQS